ncbi:MAG: hypothetical protein ABI406_18195 [Ktedonobacteraceae bacterium]
MLRIPIGCIIEKALHAEQFVGVCVDFHLNRQFHTLFGLEQGDTILNGISALILLTGATL